MTTESDLLAPIAWLIGEWNGDGRGDYPSVTAFAYREHTVFRRPRDDAPFLFYSQATWLTDPTKRPSHTESGYVRALADGRLDCTIAQPVGRAEVLEGTAADGRVELVSVAVACTPTANQVTAVRRVLEHRDGDVLWYQLDMAATGHAMGFHCEATLHRT